MSALTVAHSFRRIGLSLLALFAVALPVGAQQHPNLVRGFDPEKVYQFGDFDNVNLMNGNVILTIPIGNAYPVGGFGGSGFSYGLTLVYNSKVWDFKNAIYDDPQDGRRWATQSLPNRRSNAGMGWSLSLGQLLAASDPTNDSGKILYVDPDGSEHVFIGPLHEEDALDGATYTRDGSYLRLKAITGGYRVESPDGSFREFLNFSGGYRLDKISDWAGNQLGVSYSADQLTWTLTDSHGRAQTIKFRNRMYDGAFVKTVDEVKLRAFAGATATYLFTYAQLAPERHCLSDREVYSATADVPMLTGVTLPDGSQWAMNYYLDDTLPQTCRMGAIKSVTLPTLGKVEYDYIDWHLPAGTCPDFPLTGGWENYDVYASATPGVGTRRMKTAAPSTTIATTTYLPTLSTQPARPIGWCPNYQQPWILPGSEELAVTVTHPLGDRTKHYFSVWPEKFYTSQHGFVRTEHGLPFTHFQTDADGRFLSQETFDCAAGGTSCSPVRRSEYVRYERDSLGGTCGVQGNGNCTQVNWRAASTKTIYNDDLVENVPRYEKVDFSDFDGLGHYRQSDSSGNFDPNNTLGSPRRTFTNFNPGPHTSYPGDFTMFPVANRWILGTSTDQSVTEAGVTAKSETCFDMAVDPTTASGFLFRKRFLGGASRAGTDVVVLYTADGDGNARAEGWKGGDSGGVGTGSNLCSVALPTAGYGIDKVYEYGVLKKSSHTSGGFFEINNTWAANTDGIDFGTGLVKASRDTALVYTTYDYDSLGRVSWIKPEADAWTQITYTAATSVPSVTLAKAAIRRYPNGQTTVPLTDEEVLFDDFGRVVKERRRMPGEVWSKRSTIYDGAGHKTDVSQWEADDVAHVGWNKFRDFDPFGRPKTLIPPEGASHQTTLTYSGTRVVTRTVKIATPASESETDATTTEIYDRHGRLFQVIEPSGVNGANITTTYGYDVGSRLKAVAMTEGTTTQNRTFSYDNRGFLLSECHPEKGAAASASGCVTYGDLDARGHAGRRTDGTSDLKMVFDAAERLKEVKEFNSPQRLLKFFQYGTSESAGNRSKGKLDYAERYNYLTFLGTPYTAKIKEAYTYAGEMGRVSSKISENFAGPSANPLPTVANESFSQTWTGYDDLGKVTSMTYPACTHSACTGAPRNGRAVSFTYSDGRLTGIPGFASSMTYHRNGLTNVITHANGVAVTQAIDSFSNARTLSITASGVAAGGDNWATGNYSYDGAGNVKGIGNSRFRYDKVSRLVDATVYFYDWGRLSKSQTYTYDAFGNLQTLGSVPTPTFATKNRLNGGVYDNSGNLISWNGQFYEYGPFNEMKRRCTTTPCSAVTGEEWLYAYTVDDERIWSFKVGGVGSSRWTLRDLEGKVLREFEGIPSWGVNEDYIYRDGQLLAGAQTGRYFHLDHLGSPRLITGAGGAQLGYHVYMPFGEEVLGINQDTTRLKFTGHERDLGNPSSNADDLDYMHARFNSPVTGRMLSVDPAGGAKKRPQSWNKFSYALGNPMRFVDPDGRTVVEPTDKRLIAAVAQMRSTPAGQHAYQVLRAAPGVYTYVRKDITFTGVDERRLKAGFKLKKVGGGFTATHSGGWKSGGEIAVDFGVVDRSADRPYNASSGDAAIAAHETGHALHYELLTDKGTWPEMDYNTVQEPEADKLRDKVVRELECMKDPKSCKYGQQDPSPNSGGGCPANPTCN